MKWINNKGSKVVGVDNAQIKWKIQEQEQQQQEQEQLKHFLGSLAVDQ